jgi:hypothetical protein
LASPNQKAKLQSGQMKNGKLDLKMAEKKQPELKTTKQEKEKLKFDESSGEDEEMTDEEDMMDEFGSSEEDEMESEEEEEKQISQNNKVYFHISLQLIKLIKNFNEKSAIEKHTKSRWQKDGEPKRKIPAAAVKQGQIRSQERTKRINKESDKTGEGKVEIR